jgi:hypothetical protein
VFFAYHHRSPVWHRVTAAALGAMAALFGSVSLLFAWAAVGDRDGPLGMGAVGAFFGAFAVGFGWFARKGWVGTRRYAAAWAERTAGGDQQRYGITVDVFQVRSVAFDSLGDLETSFPRQEVKRAQVRPYDKRSYLHVETTTGFNAWLPTYLLSPQDRGQVFELLGVER